MHFLPCPQTRNESLNGLVFEPDSRLGVGRPRSKTSLCLSPGSSQSVSAVCVAARLLSLLVLSACVVAVCVATFVGGSTCGRACALSGARAYVRSSACTLRACTDTLIENSKGTRKLPDVNEVD